MTCIHANNRMPDSSLIKQKWNTAHITGNPAVGASMSTQPSGSCLIPLWLFLLCSFPHLCWPQLLAGSKVAAADVAVTSLHDNLNCHAREHLPIAVSEIRELSISSPLKRDTYCMSSQCILCYFRILKLTCVDKDSTIAQDDQGLSFWGLPCGV